MNADPNQAKALFLQAVENYAPDQWPAFLDGACLGQPELRRWIEMLLEAHRETGTGQRQATSDVPVETWQRIDPFVHRFEEAWQGGSPPTIDDFLPKESPDRLAVLKELVKVDMERRQQAGTPARPE